MARRKIYKSGTAALAAQAASLLLVASAGAQTTALTPIRHGVDSQAIRQVLQQRSHDSEEVGRDEASVSEKKKTLEGELRYSKAKLAAAQKRLAVQTAVNNFEEAEKAQTEIKDWQSRIKDTEAQLNDLNAQSRPSETGGGDDIVLPGETLDVYVVEDPSFNGHFVVRRGGYIIIPQVGRVFVAGKKIPSAEAAIRAALEANQLQHGTVMVEKLSGSDVTSGPTIYLAGEFKNPRPFKIPVGTNQTLVSVILSAGGYTDKADLTHVRVERVASNTGIVEEVDVQRVLTGGGLGSDVPLYNGDVVVIPTTAPHVFYLTGNVKRQGYYPLGPNDHLSVYAGILQNGGFSRFANIKKVYVLRATDDGTKARLPVDIAAIQKGLQPDIPLRPNDIVVIPEKFWSW